jgi:hypothetical protein
MDSCFIELVLDSTVIYVDPFSYSRQPLFQLLCCITHLHLKYPKLYRREPVAIGRRSRQFHAATTRTV